MSPKTAARVSIAFVLGALASGPAPCNAGTDCETVYRLTEKASYQDGCFPPCLCPILTTGRIRGAFVMGPPVSSNGIVSRDVYNLGWFVTLDNAEIEVYGSGVYRATSGPSPRVHALDLDLSIDGGETQHFYSGWVPVETNDASIDIPISVNGQFCHDTVIAVSAEPVVPASMLHFDLAEESTYQEGCFAPCDCPLEQPRRLDGSLSLVEILDHGTYVEYAVPHARFFARSSTAGGHDVALKGFGRYTLIQGFAGPAHVLELRLMSDGGEVQLFDSSEFNTDPTFPLEFEITVDTNDQICFDTVLSLRAVWSGPIVFVDDFECGDTSGWWSPAGPLLTRRLPDDRRIQ